MFRLDLTPGKKRWLLERISFAHKQPMQKILLVKNMQNHDEGIQVL